MYCEKQGARFVEAGVRVRATERGHPAAELRFSDRVVALVTSETGACNSSESCTYRVGD